MAIGYRLQSNPLVGRLTTKYLLPLGTRQVGDEVVFFNFGYEEDPPMALPLAATDEPNRYCIQLYHVTASQVDLAGKKVLEISCGAGGGASYIMRNLGPASYTGLDLNPASIDKCRDRHQLPGLDFVQGDAENLPFPDQSFDAVINVEASHQYPHFRRFLTEVARVLGPGGHFLYTDSRRAPVDRRVGGGAGRCPVSEDFGKVRRRRGQARAGGQYATDAGADQWPLAGGHELPNPLRRGRVGLGFAACRRVFLPGVLLRQGLMRAPGGRNRTARLRS